MKISTRLSVAGLVSVGIVVLIGAVMLAATRQVKHALGQNEIVDEIVDATASLRYLRGRFKIIRPMFSMA
jgi:hypothetical protein